MRFFSILVAGILAVVMMPLADVMAASSEWYETLGGKVRLVVSDIKEDDGTLRGALEIELEPGWKTYWRDPGSAGIPPSVEISGTNGISRTEIGFPAPKRFDDTYGSWAGYEDRVSLALTFEMNSQPLPDKISADIFLGICETICVPVQATLTADLKVGQTDGFVESVVAEAFESLPLEANEHFGLLDGELKGKTIIVPANLASGSDEPKLFVENTDGWYLGVPFPMQTDGDTVVFGIPVQQKPENSERAPSFRYTLTNGNAAVSGILKFR